MNDAKVEARELRRLAAREQDELKARRMRGVALVLEGASISAAAREVGIDRPRLSHWIARYREHGLEGLEDQRGSGSRLSDTDAWRLCEFIATRLPTTAQAATWLRDELGLSYSPTGARNVLLQVGAFMPYGSQRGSNRAQSWYLWEDPRVSDQWRRRWASRAP
jgi:transposase